MPNATASAAQAKAKAVALSKILRQRNNENSAKFFAVGMAGIMVLFIILNWTRVSFKGLERKRGRNIAFLKGPIAVTRAARSVLIRKMPLFPSVGHSLVLLAYIATTVAISFTKMDWSLPLNNVAKRFGWVSASNLALVTFLSLKNTPLAFLAASSYERLNVLHRIAGFALVVSLMLHMVIYVTAFAKMNDLADVRAPDQIKGIIAGVSIFVTTGTAVSLRRMRYELFYIIHVALFILILIMVGMHRPDITKKTVYIVIFCAAIWVADRIVRFLRITFFSFGNTATLIPLPHGGTRVVLRKSPGRAVPGSHCFLWIPGVRAVETHPFTVASTKPLEFVVAAYYGFTRDLHAAALKNPGRALKASLDGPYGNIPNFSHFTKVVLIAGGSGASFTMGVAIGLLHKLGSSQSTTIDFIWAVRESEMLEWFSQPLKELAASPLVNLHLYSTRTPNPSVQILTPSNAASLNEKSNDTPKETPTMVNSPTSAKNSGEIYDIEKQPSSPTYSSDLAVHLQSGRPDVAALVTEVVERADGNDRVIVAACGPDSLMQITRRTVAGNIKVDGPSVKYHAEQFGW